MGLAVVVCCCLFFSSVATGVLMYETTRSSNITGPDKITVSGDPTNNIENSKDFVSMRNGDATLLMQSDGNLVSRLKDTVVWQSGTKTPGAKAWVTYKGLMVVTGENIHWHSTPVRDDVVSVNPTLFLKTDGHLEFFSGGSLIWSSK